MPSSLRVLIAAPVTDADSLLAEIARGGLTATATRVDGTEPLAPALDEGGWDLVLADAALPGLQSLIADFAELPWILLADRQSEPAALAAMAAGARDYLLRDDLARLAPAILRDRAAAAERSARAAEAERAERFSALAENSQAQKMEVVGRLAGGIAHDFNNLLAVIIGYTELLQMQLPPGDPARRPADEIHRAADRAAALTHQLLAFSRKQMLAPKLLDLNEVVTRMHRMLRRVIREDIELRLAVAPGPARVRADPSQLEQVIMNLAVNAQDAMPQGGTFSLETGCLALDESGAACYADLLPGRYLTLVVADTGVGMDLETRRHLFEPFFTTKEVGQGTGLGLATVYGIVKQSGGEIEVESEPDAGTTFRLLFPEAEDPAAAGPGAGPEPLDGTETILLVDDERMVRELVRRLLQERGYQVLEAAGAEEALGLAAGHPGPVHLLLTDVVMPGLSGPELAVRLTAERPETKVLYMSGYTDERLMGRAADTPGAGFLAKPFTPDDLARKLRELLSGPESNRR